MNYRSLTGYINIMLDTENAESVSEKNGRLTVTQEQPSVLQQYTSGASFSTMSTVNFMGDSPYNC